MLSYVKITTIMPIQHFNVPLRVEFKQSSSQKNFHVIFISSDLPENSSESYTSNMRFMKSSFFSMLHNLQPESTTYCNFPYRS